MLDGVHKTTGGVNRRLNQLAMTQLNWGHAPGNSWMTPAIWVNSSTENALPVGF